MTIKSSREIDRVFREGRRISDPVLTVIASASPPGVAPGGRVAFVAGRKVGGAVVRNRAKRVMREACRRLGGPWPGLDMALIARERTARASHEEIEAAMSAAIGRLRGSA